jgi:hypothetical protein
VRSRASRPTDPEVLVSVAHHRRSPFGCCEHGWRVSRSCRTRFPPESQSTRRTPTTLPRICAWSPGIGS